VSEKVILSIDSQWLTAIQTCGRYMDYKLIQNLRPPVKPAALEKGDLLHQMLATFYRGKLEGKSHQDSFNLALTKGREASGEMQLDVETCNEVIFQFTKYCEYWIGDGWRPIEIERPFTRVFYEDSNLVIHYTGIVDLIADTQAGICISDHKSTSKNYEPSMLNNQFFGYSWSFDIPNIVVNLIGFQKTLPPEKRFVRHVLNYPKALVEEWRVEAVRSIMTAYKWMEQNSFPANFTACDKWGGCEYAQLCKTTPDAREWKAATFYVKGEPWNPYHRDKKPDTVEDRIKEAMG
jgi:hypothetical protein